MTVTNIFLSMSHRHGSWSNMISAFDIADGAPHRVLCMPLLRMTYDGRQWSPTASCRDVSTITSDHEL